jgi:AraC-like DNA-binding protein
VLGKSPLSYFQDLRVEHAQTLFHGTGLDLDAIAADVGYIDGATLRTLLRQRLGRECALFEQTCAKHRLTAKEESRRGNDAWLAQTSSEVADPNRLTSQSPVKIRCQRSDVQTPAVASV